MTIQPTPNLSDSMPKRGAKNVLPSGICIGRLGEAVEDLVGFRLGICSNRQRNTVKIRLSAAAAVRHQNRRVAQLNLRVHDLVLAAGCDHGLVG
jgi:hypothetical protein